MPGLFVMKALKNNAKKPEREDGPEAFNPPPTNISSGENI
jgi:hypothetical protein